MKKLKLVLYLLVISLNIHPEIPFFEINGIKGIIKEQYFYLFPINGFNWFKSGLIERIYRYGDARDATIKLLKDLFFLQHDNVTFDVTYLPGKITFHIKPETIGKILVAIDQYKDTESLKKQEETLKITLRKIISEDINFNALVISAQKEITKIKDSALADNENFRSFQKQTAILVKSKKYSAALANLRKKTARKAKTATGAEKAKLRERLVTIPGILSDLKKQITALTKDVKNLSNQKEVKFIQQQIRKYNLTPKSLDNFIEHLIGALRENLPQINLEQVGKGKEREGTPVYYRAKYLPYTLQQILLGFLWKKLETSKELIPLFKELNKNNMVNKKQLTQFTKSQPQYTQKGYIKLRKMLNTTLNKQQIINNYDELSFLYQGFLTYEQIIPPIISSLSNVRYKNESFSNCGGASLENFFNIISFLPGKDLFDINALKKATDQDEEFIPIVIDNKLEEFYSTYKNAVAVMGSRKIQDAWANVISERPGVRYNQGITAATPLGIAEISSQCISIEGTERCGLGNILQLINVLIFGNNVNFTKLNNTEKLNYIVEKISNDNFQLTWEPSGDADIEDETQFFITIDFTVTRHKKDIRFEWVFQSGHFYIPSVAVVIPDVENIITPLKQLLISSSFGSEDQLISFNLLSRYSNKLNTKILIQNFEDQPIIQQFLFFFNDFATNSQRLSAIKTAISQQFIKNKAILEIVKKLIKSLPKDEYYNRQIFNLLFQHKSKGLENVLKEIYIDKRSISLPEFIGNYPSIEEIDTDYGILTQLPTSLGKLKKLKRLSVNVQGTIPETIGDLKSLEVLDLRNADISELPKSLENLKKLKELSVTGSDLSSLPAYIQNLKNLEVLNISDNQFTQLPAFIGSLPNLKVIKLENNYFSSLPAELVNLKNLEKIYLRGNRKDIYIPRQLKDKIVGLFEATLYELPSDFRKLKHLRELTLAIDDTVLPNEIGLLENLQRLTIIQQQLKELPEAIGNLKELKELTINGAQLSRIPESIGNLSNLETLSLADNQITQLPASIGKLKKLKYLYLSNNDIATLPPGLAKLPELKEIDLKGNKTRKILMPKVLKDKVTIEEDY